MLLNRKTYIVKERVAVVKLTNTYDLLDAESGQPIGVAKEEPAAWAKWLRLVVKKAMMPTIVNVYENESPTPFLSVQRGWTLLRPRVAVILNGRPIGTFQKNALTLREAFQILDAQNNVIGKVQGDWKGWNFQLVDANGQELGNVTKKWAGLGKELFTNANMYAINLSDAAVAREETAALMLAAGLAIELVFREGR
jgi:uncharacterized protein YxjI